MRRHVRQTLDGCRRPDGQRMRAHFVCRYVTTPDEHRQVTSFNIWSRGVAPRREPASPASP
jgi:hypothetical protein